MGYGIHSALGCRVDRGCWRRQTARGGADVDDASALGTEPLHRFLGRQNQPQHIGVEQPVELLLRNLPQRRKLVDAGVIHQNVQRSKCFLRLSKEALHVGCLGHIALHGDRSATLFHDLRDYALGTFFT